MRRSSSCAHIATSFFSSAGSSIREYEPDTLWLVLRLRLWVGPPPAGAAAPEAAHAEAGARGRDDLGRLALRPAVRAAPLRDGRRLRPRRALHVHRRIAPGGREHGASARASKVTLC